MEGLDRLLNELRMGLRSLQVLQDEYDRVGWHLSNPPFRKYRHICLHLSVLVGRLSALSEKLDHTEADGASVNLSDYSEELEQTTSNIVFHLAQIANLANFELYDAMVDRYSANARRFAPQSVFAFLDSCDRDGDPRTAPQAHE